MLFQNTKDVILADASFIGNQQENIRLMLASIQVTNSTFSDGKRSHIRGEQSHIKLANVTMLDSTDNTAQGLGLYCS